MTTHQLEGEIMPEISEGNAAGSGGETLADSDSRFEEEPKNARVGELSSSPAGTMSVLTSRLSSKATSPPQEELPSPRNEASWMEIDTESSDTDSALGHMAPSSTVSLSDSVYAFQEENGLTYHAYNRGKYFLPNNAKEQGRLDLQHHLFYMTLDGDLHLAPLDTSRMHNVIDIGTGTGLWAIEFAQRYPSAKVVGTDLSPIQPLFIPANCSFEITDCEEEWTFSQKFDYIHGRAMLSCFRDQRNVLANIWNNLAPGGYFELQDPTMPLRSIDGTIEGTALDYWQKNTIAGAKNLGVDITQSMNFGALMREVGFEDVTERHFYWPTNTWAKGAKNKELGRWCMQNLLDGFGSIGMRILTKGLGWSKEQVDICVEEAKVSVSDKQVHAYIDVYIVYGRKPVAR